MGHTDQTDTKLFNKRFVGMSKLYSRIKVGKDVYCTEEINESEKIDICKVSVFEFVILIALRGLEFVCKLLNSLLEKLGG